MTSHVQVKRRQWPSAPDAICALIQDLLPGWGVTHQPAFVIAGTAHCTLYAVSRGSLRIEAAQPWQVLRCVADLADEEVPAWATQP